MRLINTSTLELEEFIGEKRPPYAILSHMWEAQELSLQAFQKREALDSAGYSKIKRFCAIANEDGFLYAWADTCCIDKTSSAELSEAINSMYKWYQGADVCYAYLADLSVADHKRYEVDSTFLNKPRRFKDSRWFSRGWTLQELLAPNSVVFYDQDWVEIGTRFSLMSEVSEATRISTTYLTSMTSPHQASIAQRMSWASARMTTRIEDTAYCLLGLFDVNIPLLYGEGKKAFIRLQDEIIRTIDDESIFAWSLPSSNRNPSLPLSSGILAESPACFEASGTIVSVPRHSGEPATLTNRGMMLDCTLWSQATKLPMDKIFYDIRLPSALSPIPWRFFANEISAVARLACAPIDASGERVILWLHYPPHDRIALSRVKCDCLSIMRQVPDVKLFESLPVNRLLTSRKTTRTSVTPRSYTRDVLLMKIRLAKVLTPQFVPRRIAEMGFSIIPEHFPETLISRETGEEVELEWIHKTTGRQLSVSWLDNWRQVGVQVAIMNRKRAIEFIYTLKNHGESAQVSLEDMDDFQVTLKSGLASDGVPESERCLIVDFSSVWGGLRMVSKTGQAASGQALEVEAPLQETSSTESLTCNLHESFFGKLSDTSKQSHRGPDLPTPFMTGMLPVRRKKLQ